MKHHVPRRVSGAVPHVQRVPAQGDGVAVMQPACGGEGFGRREAEEQTVALRSRGAGKKQDILTQDAFVARVLEEIRTRALPVAAVAPAEASA